MKRVCAWCNREMENGEGTPVDDGIVTHGICGECADNIEFQLGVSIKKFLNSFKVPVILLDGNNRAISANRFALDLVKKNLASINHVILGNVFECAYSRLPGGCGKTSHCSGCTIRNAIMDTFRTGEPNLEVPATVTSGSMGDGEAVALRISTEKALNYVLLKIEPA
jgi:hypothetical protein